MLAKWALISTTSTLNKRSFGRAVIGLLIAASFSAASTAFFATVFYSSSAVSFIFSGFFSIFFIVSFLILQIMFCGFPCSWHIWDFPYWGILGKYGRAVSIRRCLGRLFNVVIRVAQYAFYTLVYGSYSIILEGIIKQNKHRPVSLILSDIAMSGISPWLSGGFQSRCHLYLHMVPIYRFLLWQCCSFLS